jgi:hypothetical protein
MSSDPLEIHNFLSDFALKRLYTRPMIYAAPANSFSEPDALSA